MKCIFLKIKRFLHKQKHFGAVLFLKEGEPYGHILHEPVGAVHEIHGAIFKFLSGNFGHSVSPFGGDS